MNDFKNTTDAADAAYNANAGWGKSPDTCRKDQTGGYKTIHARVNGFLRLIDSGALGALKALSFDKNAPID